jgi:hypothetical protein
MNICNQFDDRKHYLGALIQLLNFITILKKATYSSDWYCKKICSIFITLFTIQVLKDAQEVNSVKGMAMNYLSHQLYYFYSASLQTMAGKITNAYVVIE